MRKTLRTNKQFFLWAGLAAVALRLLFVFRFPGIVDDSRLYANVATNWLKFGIYGVTDSGQVTPTLSRLPGYPAFLAAIFVIFGIDHFRAVLLIQVLFDLGTCLLIADMARRLFSERSAKAAFLLAGLCPFLANYAAAALTETLEIFFTALALDLVLCGLGIDGKQSMSSEELVAAPRQFRSLTWLGCGLAIGASILLRPDGGILLAAVGGYLLLVLFRAFGSRPEKSPTSLSPSHVLRACVVVGLAALAPLVPWTIRNELTLHRFEPLAPRYANDSDELVVPGFNRWVKTWMADYVSVQEIYWPVPGADVDISRLPSRAFDSEPQREDTESLLNDYNHEHEVTAELDARFAMLAATRVHAAPLRYYVWLPALRVADMWLRPRTELLPSDPRWWEFDDDGRWLAVSIAFGLLNLAYVILAAAGLVRSRAIFGIGLFVLFLLLRSAFLGTLENPEPRYTLECYPAVILWAAARFQTRSADTDPEL